MILVLVANMFLASTFTLAKILVNYIQPVYLAGYRAIAGGILLLLMQLIWDRKHFFIKWRFVSSLFQIAFFSIFLSYALEYWSFQYINSIKATLFYTLSTFITPIYAFFFFGQRMTRRKWLGLCIGLAGVLPTLLASSPSEETMKAFGTFSWPELALLCGVAAYCYGWVHIKKLMLQQYPPFMINGVALLWGGIMALGAAHLTETWQPITEPMAFLGWFWLLVILGNVFAANLYAVLFKYYTISLVAFSTLTIPLFAAVYSYFLLGETMTKEMMLSMVIISVGLYIFYQEELKQGYIHNHH